MKTKRIRWTSEEVKQLEELVACGEHSIQDIADIMGIKYRRVSDKLSRMKLSCPSKTDAKVLASIMKLREQGKPFWYIGKVLNLPESTIVSIVYRHDDSRSNRPRLTNEEKLAILEMALKEPSPSVIAKTLNLNYRQVLRYLHKNNIYATK